MLIKYLQNKNYIAPREVVKHVDEVLKLMQVLTKDKAWGNNGIAKRKGAPYMDHYLSDRIAEAKIEAYLDCGLSISEIAVKLNISEEEVSDIIKKLETKNLQKQN